MDRSKLSVDNEQADRNGNGQADRTSYLKSFLDNSPTILVEEQPQQIGSNPECPVCQTPLEQGKKRICKFCNLNICKQHLRKKRQLRGRFERECDNCQDKYLFDRFMKFESKAEEADAIQQQILSLKLEDIQDILRAKRMAIKVQTEKVLDMNRRYQQKHDLLISEYRIMVDKDKQMDIQVAQLEKREADMKETERKMPRSLQDDFNAMTKENQKLTKELSRLEKRSQQLKFSIQRKQKQVLEQFNKWQQEQTAPAKKQQPNKEGCLLF